MSETAKPARPSPILYLLLFIVAAAALSYLSLRHRNDYITLTINNEWNIYLMGEDRLNSAKYHPAQFTETKRDSRHLWLKGQGDIHWLKNVIRVHKAGVFFNHKLFTKFYRESQVNIVFTHDGSARKGLPDQTQRVIPHS